MSNLDEKIILIALRQILSNQQFLLVEKAKEDGEDDNLLYSVASTQKVLDLLTHKEEQYERFTKMQAMTNLRS